jgi:CBS domain-containing protein
MGTVRNLLQKKGYAVYSTSPDSSVYDALEILEDKNLGSLLVMDNDRLVGVFTERDYARKVILKGRSSRDTLIRDIMTDTPIVVTEDHTIDQCMQIMSDKHIRHLPVMEGDRVIGLISISDIVRFVIEEKDYLIDTLTHYITD